MRNTHHQKIAMHYLVLILKLEARSTLTSKPRFHARPRFPVDSHKPCRPRKDLDLNDRSTGTGSGTQGERQGNLAAAGHQKQTVHVRMGFPQAQWSWPSEYPGAKIKGAYYELLIKVISTQNCSKRVPIFTSILNLTMKAESSDN